MNECEQLPQLGVWGVGSMSTAITGKTQSESTVKKEEAESAGGRKSGIVAVVLGCVLVRFLSWSLALGHPSCLRATLGVNAPCVVHRA